MTDHCLIKPIFQEAGDDLDLLPDDLVGIFDQVGLIVEIIACQRNERG